MNRIGEPWQRCPKPRKLTPLVRERPAELATAQWLAQREKVVPMTLRQQIYALESENAELVKDKNTLTCALEYAKKDCAYWIHKHDAILLKFGQKLAKKRKAKR